jgi:hypothetical protein
MPLFATALNLHGGLLCSGELREDPLHIAWCLLLGVGPWTCAPKPQKIHGSKTTQLRTTQSGAKLRFPCWTRLGVDLLMSFGLGLWPLALAFVWRQLLGAPAEAALSAQMRWGFALICGGHGSRIAFFLRNPVSPLSEMALGACSRPFAPRPPGSSPPSRRPGLRSLSCLGLRSATRRLAAYWPRLACPEVGDLDLQSPYLLEQVVDHPVLHSTSP